MDPQQEPTFNEDLQTIVSQLPVPVQDFFASGKSEIVANNIMQKYRLHIDQGTIVEREIIMLLLGLKNPDEFMQTLSESKFDKQTVDSIVQDVNTQIFVPLRAEERKSGIENAPQPTKPAVPSAAPRPTEASGVVGPPPQSPSYFHLENKIPLARPLRPTLHTGRPPTPIPPRPMDSSKLLEDHEEPHIEFKKVPAPPPNLPGVLPPQSKPVTPVTSYSTDPYREPIE